MEFLKNFNNNAALVKDQDGVEWIVIGNGIGFNKKKGEVIEQGKIERRFKAENTSNTDYSQVEKLLTINPELLNVVEEVTKAIEPELKIRFADHNYLILADHLNFALQRLADGEEFTYAGVHWEIRKFFPKEYGVAKKAINIFNHKLSVDLPESEIVFLTYHFINAQMDQGEMMETMKITKLIQNIVEIIQYNYQLVIDTGSFDYGRFISHLRYFLLRLIRQQDEFTNDLDPVFLESVQKKYPKAYDTVEKISNFLYKQESWPLGANEKLYLSLHIWRLTRKYKGNNN